jgi:hypothetical protein
MATPTDERKIAFPNPDGLSVYGAQFERHDQLGDLWEAARAAKVKPATIAQWVRRKKVEPVLSGEGGMVFHLPTIVKASQRPIGRPRKDAAQAA